jgi:O-antigen ligase
MVIVGLVLVAAIALLGPETLRERAQSMVDPRDPTVVERFHMWESGLAMWATRRWLGVGPGGVKELFPRFAQPEATKKESSHLHSAPLQMLAERGIVGLAAWLWIWVAFYASAARALRALPEERWRERALVVGSLAAVTGFLAAGLTEYNFGDSEVVMVAWALMAMPFVAGRGAGETAGARG